MEPLKEQQISSLHDGKPYDEWISVRQSKKKKVIKRHERLQGTHESTERTARARKTVKNGFFHRQRNIRPYRDHQSMTADLKGAICVRHPCTTDVFRSLARTFALLDRSTAGCPFFPLGPLRLRRMSAPIYKRARQGQPRVSSEFFSHFFFFLYPLIFVSGVRPHTVHGSCGDTSHKKKIRNTVFPPQFFESLLAGGVPLQQNSSI